MGKTNNMNAIKEANTNGIIQESTTLDGKRTITNNLLQACVNNVSNTRPLKTSDFSTRELYKSWVNSCKALQLACFDYYISCYEGEGTQEQKNHYNVAKFNLKNQFGIFLNRFKERGLITIKIQDSDITAITGFSYRVNIDKNDEDNSNAQPLLTSVYFFRNRMEDFLANRILQTGFKSGVEQLHLKAERAARRKAKKAAEKAVKAEAELAKTVTKESPETTPKTV